jgi:hypothetical protein
MAIKEADRAPADPKLNGEKDYLSELKIGKPIKMKNNDSSSLCKQTAENKNIMLSGAFGGDSLRVMSGDAKTKLVSACDDDFEAENLGAENLGAEKRPSHSGRSSTSSAARRAKRSSSLGKRPEPKNNKNYMAMKDADRAPAIPKLNGEAEDLSEINMGKPR